MSRSPTRIVEFTSVKERSRRPSLLKWDLEAICVVYRRLAYATETAGELATELESGADDRAAAERFDRAIRTLFQMHSPEIP